MKKLFLLIVGIIISLPLISQELVEDIDGNVYKTVTIGNQIWMAENLKVTRFNNGDQVTQVLDRREFRDIIKGDQPTIWLHYDFDESLDDTYGKLYNWWAANDPRGLCPVGWKIPSEDELKSVLKELDKRKPGNQLKEGTTKYWLSTTPAVNNISGFTALPGGRCVATPYACVGKGEIGQWWITDEFSKKVAWTFRLTHNIEHVTWEYLRKNYVISVRCIKK